MNKHLLVSAVIISIFLFWFLLGKGNFFHWDEWSMFILAGKSWDSLFLTGYADHYIPLNLLYYWMMIRAFGLNYVPYQLVVAFLHAINSGLMYLIIFKMTKRYWLAILSLLIFGFSNVGVENLIWSLGMNYLSASLLVSLAVFFFVSYESDRKPILLILCAFSLLISPLFHNITILMPSGFLIIYLTLAKTKIKKLALAFVLVQIILLSLSLYFSNGKIVEETKLSLSKLIQMGVFVIVGIIRGNILRFIVPGSHFEQGANLFSKFFMAATALGSLTTIIGFSSAVALKNWQNMTKLHKIFRYLFLMILIYLAAAPARSGINIGQAGISRYAYMSFFFGLIFIFLILNELVKNQKTKLVTIGCFAFLFILNINANINFNFNFWSKLVDRDRKFISETRILFQKNSTIPDLNPKGIWPTMKLSQMWFLFPKNKKLTFISPSNSSLSGWNKRFQKRYENKID